MRNADGTIERPCIPTEMTFDCPCNLKGIPRKAGCFPRNRLVLQSVSGHPLLGLKGDIHEGLEVRTRCHCARYRPDP